MTAGTVTLVAFGSIALLALAATLVIRDLVCGARVAGGAVAAAPGRLRRMPNVFDQAPLQGFFGRVDQGFDRLVLESGTELTSYAAFLLLLVGGLLLGGGAWLYTAEPLNGVAGGLAGMALPLVGLAIRRSRRLAAVREQLPHVLDMLARGTRAGQSVEQAIQLVAEEAGGVLGAEFRRCRQQLEMGRAFDRTLKALAARVRLVEMRILTTTLIVQRQTGGHLSETLERMAGVIRDRLNAQRQIRAATGAGRTSTLVVAGIAPLAYLCVFAFHREHIDVLYQDAAGRLLLLTALVLEMIGLLWVFALLRREE